MIDRISRGSGKNAGSAHELTCLYYRHFHQLFVSQLMKIPFCYNIAPAQSSFTTTFNGHCPKKLITTETSNVNIINNASNQTAENRNKFALHITDSTPLIYSVDLYHNCRCQI